MPGKWGITFNRRGDKNRGQAIQYVTGVVSRINGITAGITKRKEKAHPFKKKPVALCEFLNTWHMCKYPGSEYKFRAEKIL